MRRLMIAIVFCMTLQVARVQSASPACDGDIAVVRISTIKPTGSMEGFLKAQEAHLAWYRSHGYRDNLIYSARVLVRDPVTRSMKYSDTEIMTFHVRPPSDVTQDAAWNAYVKQYRDNSDIKSEYNVCLPKK